MTHEKVPIGTLMYGDVCGPMLITLIVRAKYFILFRHDYLSYSEYIL